MSTPKEITGAENIIDSRDVIDRVEYIKSEIELQLEDFRDEHPRMKEKNLVLRLRLEDDEFDFLMQELEMLEKVVDQCDGCSDWKYGEILIADEYFEDYAKELAEDVCEMPRDIKWPYTFIDWKEAAEELKVDYAPVDVDGNTYWIRS